MFMNTTKTCHPDPTAIPEKQYKSHQNILQDLELYLQLQRIKSFGASYLKELVEHNLKEW